MDLKHYLFFNAFIIFGYFESAVTHLPFPNEENSEDSRPSATYKPLVPMNPCEVLPAESTSVFRDLVGVKCYVDKTWYINKMVQDPQVFWFLSRPRRFGKTLLISTMKSFFLGETQLFRSTEIYSRHIKNWPIHPVIRLDFSFKISVESFEIFKYTMLKKLKDEADLHNIKIDEKVIEVALGDLIKGLNKKYNQKIVILIDEYDSPYTKAYAENKEKATMILQSLQSFFSTLKGAVEVIRFSFTTGITRPALSSFFSGANAARDITMNPQFANIVGFTRNELEEYFRDYIAKVATSKGKTTAEIIATMKKWHEGFRFTIIEESLYNPISVIAFLRTGGEVRAWSQSGGPSQFLVNKLKKFPAQTVEMVLEDASNETNTLLTASEGELTGKYSFGEDNLNSLIALLFHNGYLSISNFNSEKEIFSLRFTNLELKEDFSFRVYIGITGFKNEGSIVVQMYSAVKDLNDRKWNSFIKHLNATNSRIPYEHLSYQKPRLEAWFQFVMYIMLELINEKFQSKLLVMEDTTNKGRADIAYSVGKEVIIFEPKMDKNPENPVYECKEKYIWKYLFGQKENVTCFGLKFTPSGIIESWGVAVFSKEGKLIEETGNILLSIQLRSEEEQNITSEFKKFKTKHPNFTLQPEEAIEFLEKIGPTVTDESLFAKKFTANIETLCIFLSQSKSLFEPNLKGIMHGFLERRKKDKEREEKEKNGGILLKKSVMLVIH